MISRCTVLIFALILVASRLGAEGEKQDDTQKFQGEWTPFSIELDSKSYPEDIVKNSKLIIKGNEYIQTLAGQERTYRFKLDPAKNPKEIDLTRESSPKDVIKGIYKFDGDKLVVCRALTSGVERPKEFKSTDRIGISEYKRKEKK
jgi:uncharacterized protein (TIGR03067 family)